MQTNVSALRYNGMQKESALCANVHIERIVGAGKRIPKYHKALLTLGAQAPNQTIWYAHWHLPFRR
jgi:hypothetical protein